MNPNPRPSDAPSIRLAAQPTRSQRPAYVDRLPPCNHACPAGENIQAWLAEAQAGRYRMAWEILVRDNPMPAVHGRVCYHPCEDACNRRDLDEPVTVRAVERFLGDLALVSGWTFEPVRPPSNRRVLVVGAGPSGLAAAYHLARAGHAVTIHEAGPVAGGMMHFGIPRYRLPREVLDAEIRRIEALGVTIVLNHKVTDLVAEQQAGGFDAVFVAVGAHLGRRQAIPGGAARVFDALQFLASVERGAAPSLGRRVVIYGGGNTAMDAARTARRLGAESVIVYRRTREQMPAHDFEADEAIEEGVDIRWLRTIKAFDGRSITVEVMTLDESGFPQPSGELETFEADSLVLALGQDTDTAFLANVPEIELRKDGTVVVGADMMTGRPGIFAGGDMVPAERTVTTAVGHGKKAARQIDGWLRSENARQLPKHEIVTAGMLHVWYRTTTRRAAQPALDPSQRSSTFDEIVQGLDGREARCEAQRCLSCGSCFECDGCFSACPEHAIEKLGSGLRYAVDLTRCTGCAVCFEQCPCAAITMVPEPAMHRSAGL